MKRKFFIILTVLATAVLFAGCNDPAPTATIEPEGEEVILTEKILTEKVITEEITWDNAPTQTWD